MKRIALPIVLALILSGPVYAGEYQSPFGFRVDLPSHWLILSKQELKDNPDVFDFSTERFPTVNRDLLEQIRATVESGRAEVYINLATSAPSFSDNINVFKTVGKMPSNEQELSRLCDGLPAQLSQIFGRKINVYSCELRKVNVLKALYLDFDGVVEGTRSLQYQIQKLPSIVIVVTATCRNSNLETIRREFDEIISPMRMQ